MSLLSTRMLIHKMNKTMTPLQPLFLSDPYLKTTQATVTAITEEGGIVLDQTIFYATSGGQPGDSGQLVLENGDRIDIATTCLDRQSRAIVHVPREPEDKDGNALPNHTALTEGMVVTLEIDWARRHKLMRMHTACHLLSVVCPFPITGANVGETDSRIDFEMPQPTTTKQAVSEQLMALVNANHRIYDQWIDQKALQENPGLVKSKNVKPPQHAQAVRLVCIGEDASIDSQPCGGTHVGSTSEVGQIHIGKIEKKGRENRRFRIRFGPLPAQ